MKWTGTIALVFSVITRSMFSVFMQNESSQSTKTGTAPNSAIAPTVATYVFAAVITSSPWDTPRAFKESLIASVPELTPTAYFEPIRSAKLSSNFDNSAPRVKSPVATNSFSRDQRSSHSLNCSSRYEYRTFIGHSKLIDCIRLMLKYFSADNESGSRP